jgi:CubicO group peptidase (beta-lactamase class C family)
MLLHEVVSRHVAPGASAAVTVRCGEVWCTLFAQAGQLAPDDPTRVSLTTVYDLASVSKSLFAFALARTFDRRVLSARDHLADVLPAARNSPSAETTLEQLLSHRSGLSAHSELFAPLRDDLPWDRDEALRSAARSIVPGVGSAQAGSLPVTYSDLGYILLGEALKERLGAPLDRLLEDELRAVGVAGLASSDRLRLHDAWWVAPTEHVAWRGGLLRGVVHDENAFALSGWGCSGHAGAFGDAKGLVQFAQLMLDVAGGRSAALSPDSRALLLNRRAGGTHRAGFDSKAAHDSSVGDVLGEQCFGHLGFTGTSFWCDPIADLAVVLLTNRVCPSRANTAIRQARPRVHDHLAAAGLALREELVR